jgi:hypothetical protein
MARKISGKKMRRKTGITARQKSARRKNIAVARKARKKGGGEASGAARLKPKHLTSSKATMKDFLGAINKYGGTKKGIRSISRSLDRSYLRGKEKSHVGSMIYRISQSL